MDYIKEAKKIVLNENLFRNLRKLIKAFEKLGYKSHDYDVYEKYAEFKVDDIYFGLDIMSDKLFAEFTNKAGKQIAKETFKIPSKPTDRWFKETADEIITIAQETEIE